MNSSMILDAQWEDGVLTIIFNTGAIYAYYDVPKEVYDELLAAPSAGRYLNENVKGVYEYERVG